MVTHNAKICESEVTQELRKAFPHREGRCFFFTGEIDPKVATELYVSAVDYYDHKKSVLIIVGKEGKKRVETTMHGFSTYEKHLGSRETRAQGM